MQKEITGGGTRYTLKMKDLLELPVRPRQTNLSRSVGHYMTLYGYNVMHAQTAPKSPRREPKSANREVRVRKSEPERASPQTHQYTSIPVALIAKKMKMMANELTGC